MTLQTKLPEGAERRTPHLLLLLPLLLRAVRSLPPRLGRASPTTAPAKVLPLPAPCRLAKQPQGEGPARQQGPPRSEGGGG